METHFLTGNTQCLYWKCWSKHAPGTPGIPKKFQVFPVKNEHFPQNFVFSYRPFHTAFSTEQNSCAINEKKPSQNRWMQHCHVISGMGLESNHWIQWQGDSYSENLISSTSTWFQNVPFCSLISEQFLFSFYDHSFRCP